MKKFNIKNKNKAVKTATLSALTAALLSGAAIGIAGTVNADAEVWKGDEIKSVYSYGDTFKIPDYVLNVNGKEIKAGAVIEFPDGTNYGTGEVRLSQAGRYEVKYAVNDGGKIYVKTFDFNVGYTAYSSGVEQSETSYGEYKEFDANSVGLKVRLAKGDTLTFTQLIDVSDLTATNNIIEGFITPDKRGSADFDKLTVTLTDSSDPSVYVAFDIMRWTINNNALGNTCVAAAGQGQLMTGYEPSLSTASKLEVNNGKGTLILASWVAQFNSDDGEHLGWGQAASNFAPDKGIISVAFDNTSTKAYAQGNLVSQLNSVDYYKDVWTGFRSDKVRLSITASGYSGDTANFCLTKVLGSDIVGNTFVDDGAPTITVNTSYDKMPEGVVGRRYSVPTASAYDDYAGDLETEVNVYYNYSSACPVSVSVTDGAFVPAKAGYYTIVYTAEDYSGNDSRVVYTMHAGGEIAPIDLTLPEIVSEAKLGYPLKLDAPQVSGGSGEKTIVVTATFGDETTEISDGFKLEKSGEWTITYTATDYVGNTASKSVKINAVASEEPFFAETAVLDPVYIADSEYSLPEMYCDDYSTGKLEKQICKVKVEYPDGTTERYTSGDKFIPRSENGGDKLKITYYYDKDEYNGGTQEIAVIKVRNDEEIDCSAYFYGEGFIASYEDADGNEYDKGVSIAVAKAANEVKWTFANAQVADNFSVEFTTFDKLTKFNKIKITLKDYLNPSLSATFDIALSSVGTTVSSGDFALELKDVLTTGKDGIKVGYKNGKFSFGKTNVPINAYDNGDEFKGFPSGKVYFDFAIENVLRGAEYKIDAVSGNILSSDTGDYAKPTIKINGDYGGNYNLNDEYVLHPVTSGDTFCPNVSVKLSVYDGDGNIVTDKNGEKLENVDASKEYIVKLDKYGVWNAKYTAQKENWAVGSRKFTAYINVNDNEAPVIEITSDYTKTAKVGDVIVLPDFSVSDNVTATENITVTKYVINAEGKITLLSGNGNSFRATKAGKYVMCITVSDEFGNTQTRSYTVTVE